jgi:hypothetical protein
MNFKLSRYFLVFSLLLGIVGCATTPLMEAAKGGDTKKAISLLETGANVNEKGYLSFYWGTYLSTPLHAAVIGGHTDTVKTLLDRGADVNALDEAGYPPLAYAAVNGNDLMARLLLGRGAQREQAMARLEMVPVDTSLISRQARAGLKVLERLDKERKAVSEIQAPVSDKYPSSISPVQSDVDKLPAGKAKPNRNAYAIVMGIERYRQKLPNADFAAHDAEIVKEYLAKAMGYPEENIILLQNDRALKSDLEKYLGKWLANNTEPDSAVFIYFSGHGAPNPKTGEAYLVPYDGDPKFLDDTGYPLKRLYENLSRLPAKEVVVVLDACFSGAGGRSVIAEGARPLVMNLEQTPAPAKNMIVITAASGEEISSTYEEKGHGLFTYYFLKGLKGEAEFEKSGGITVRNLYEYVKSNVPRIARRLYNHEQTPQLIAPKEKETMLLRK